MMQMIEYFKGDSMLELYEDIKRYTFETNSNVENINILEDKRSFTYKLEAIVVFRSKEAKNDK